MGLRVITVMVWGLGILQGFSVYGITGDMSHISYMSKIDCSLPSSVTPVVHVPKQAILWPQSTSIGSRLRSNYISFMYP